MKIQLKKLVISIVVFFFFIELVSIIWLTINFSTSFIFPDLLLEHFYPELNFELEDNDKTKILILGGSVLYGEEIRLEIEGQAIISHFCDLKNSLSKDKYQVISLARPGHTSLDSWYKYQYLKNKRFDYVFIYHGINDARANNWPIELFDSLYRHIEFYDDIAVVLEHPEMPYYTTRFALDWLLHSILKKGKSYLPKELFQGLLAGKPEAFLEYGSEIKTEKTFKKNIQNIIELGGVKNENIILSSFAWYLPDNYSYQAFTEKKLDYDQQVFPTELYGLPMNVKKALLVHNEILHQLSDHNENVIFLDLANEIPNSKNYFDDICHLNNNGCEIMALTLDSAITNQYE